MVESKNSNNSDKFNLEATACGHSQVNQVGNITAERVNFVADNPQLAGKPFQAPPLPSYYVDRPEYSKDLKNRLLAESPDVRTLVVTAIHGLGSIGKSTLATALAHNKEVQKHYYDGILWATLGQQPNLLSLLSGWVQALGDYNFKATSVEATSTQLRRLLYDKAVLLVVDDAWNPEHAKVFNIGGARCQVLVTTRESAIAKILGASTYPLNVMNPEQAMELLSKKLERKLTHTETREAQAFAKEVGYLPLALELAAAQVADGISWTVLLQDMQQEVVRLEEFDDPEARDASDEAILKRLSLTASLNLSIKRLKPKERKEFIWLGILPEDVNITETMTAILWDIDQRKAKQELRYLHGKSLLLPGVTLADGTATYRLHDLFHDLACNLLTAPINPEEEGNLPGLGITLPDAHAIFLEKYRNLTDNNLWHTLPNDGYIHQRLVWHLEKAQKLEEIHKLLAEDSETGTNGWYQACEKLGQTANFITDVARAWQLAEDDKEKYLPTDNLNTVIATIGSNPKPLEIGNECVSAKVKTNLSQVIGLQCRYGLITASLNSLAANLPVELLIALVQKNVWTPEQALAYALQKPELEQKVKSIAELVNFLPPNLEKLALSEALSAARSIQSEKYRADALRNLAPLLPENLLTEALSAARSIQSEKYRADALRNLAPLLPENLLTEALSAARSIQSEKYRAHALRNLAPLLPENLLTEALSAARSIQSEKYRAHALITLAPLLPENLLTEALSAARSIQSEKYRAHALITLAPLLPENLLTEALSAARSIQHEYSRAHALITLAPLLPEENLLTEALSAARSIQHEYSRAHALITLADKLSQIEKKQLFSHWQETLHILSLRTRRDLLSDIKSLTPVIFSLGGKEGLRDVADAIVDVTRWWK